MMESSSAVSGSCEPVEQEHISSAQGSTEGHVVAQVVVCHVCSLPERPPQTHRWRTIVNGGVGSQGGATHAAISVGAVQAVGLVRGVVRRDGSLLADGCWVLVGRDELQAGARLCISPLYMDRGAGQQALILQARAAVACS